MFLSNASANEFKQRVALSRRPPFPNDQQLLLTNAELIPSRPSVDPKQQSHFLLQVRDKIGYGTGTEVEKHHVIVIIVESGFLLEKEKKGFGSFPGNRILELLTPRDTIIVGDPGSAG